MGKCAKPIILHLTVSEAAALLVPVGEGGQQIFHQTLIAQLQHGNLTVSLCDADLGKLIRYMTQYGSGGFQGRLRKAFIRPLNDLLAA